MTNIQQAYVVSAIRTPIGKSGRGSLSKLRPDDLLAQTLKQLVAMLSLIHI